MPHQGRRSYGRRASVAQPERPALTGPTIDRETPDVAQPLDRITHSPDILAGRATVRGLRVSVSHIVNLVANGMTQSEIIADLPDLDDEDIRQALAYAAALAKDELHPLHA